MSPTFTAEARQVGAVTAVVTALLIAAYAITLIIGLASLQSPDDPIGDPWFTTMEVLIIVMMPVMVGLMAAVHAWASVEAKVFSLLALIFMSMVAIVTMGLHFTILTLSRQPEFAQLEWAPLLLSFKWPSIAYALDILAWDVFFSLSVLCAAPVFKGSMLAKWIAALLVVSGVLAIAGLSGVALNDMQFRNIGIVGYVGVFPIAAVLLAVLFQRTPPHRSTETG